MDQPWREWAEGFLNMIDLDLTRMREARRARDWGDYPPRDRAASEEEC